jgi:hypothetical protein
MTARVAEGGGPCEARACLYSVVKQGQQFLLYRNGRLLGAAAHCNVGGLSNELRIGMWFGEGQEWKGDVGEIILCEGGLDTPQRERVEGYLSEKWGVFFAQQVMMKETTWSATLLSSRDARIFSA